MNLSQDNQLQTKISELEKYFETMLKTPVNDYIKEKMITIINEYKSQLMGMDGMIKIKNQEASKQMLDEILKEIPNGLRTINLT